MILKCPLRLLVVNTLSNEVMPEGRNDVMPAGISSSHVHETPGLKIQCSVLLLCCKDLLMLYPLEFEPLFAKISKSHYEEKYIFQDCLMQQSALSEHMHHNPDTRDTMDISDDNTWKMCAVNPCDFDYMFHGIRGGLL